MFKTKISNEQLLLIRDRYERGERLIDLATEVDVSDSTLCHRLKRLGVKTHKGYRLSLHQRQQLRVDYQSGVVPKDLELKYKLKWRSLRGYLKDAGIVIRSKEKIIPDKIKCWRCQIKKPLKEMVPDKRKYHGRKYECLACQGILTRVARYRKSFGIEVEQYDQMLQAQGGCCALCKTQEYSHKRNGRFVRFAVDHCHTTGRIRGLLCWRCNLAIGLLKDDTSAVIRLVNYLSIGSLPPITPSIATI